MNANVGFQISEGMISTTSTKSRFYIIIAIFHKRIPCTASELIAWLTIYKPGTLGLGPMVCVSARTTPIGHLFVAD